ncbi:vWA domain-containing protein [Ruminococcus flavefaciens]|uniref:vWA domain-containing protein n=1 Tax=Ruminococcus flavefaciens TaxID=1265 RepID=UPI0026F2E42E|nr:vWA domain-containing protein [Ruminococcus flavefaciens]
MKKNLTELVFILDESGSMSGLTSDTIGGFNSLIAKQKKEEGEALVSTVFFSNSSKVIHDRAKLDDVPELTDRDYVPSGCTALLDAVGDAVKHIANIHKYAREEDIPEKTLFVITTDGMENASRKYTHREVKNLIERVQEEKGWEFVFLGANIDAAETAGSIGIRAENAVDYHADECGTAVLFESVACAVSDIRANKGLARTWKKSVEEDNKRRGK